MIKKYESTLISSSQTRKKRPSIEFSPTLQKPVFIITKNLNGRHIIDLIEQLDRHKIPYQMQQQTQTLGFKLNQRFFVIVDNRSGEVTLGAEFGSILMTVVGYPRIGKNKKNKYFEKPSQIIDFYELFKNNKDISQREKSLINKQYCDVILERDNNSKLKSKIVVRSISKYKSPEKESYLKGSDIKEKKGDKKLIIIQDKTSEVYTKLCDLLSSLIPKESLFKIQKVEQVRQLTLFTTNKAQIYYLVNQSHERELLDVIFIGEALVFNSQIALRNLKSVFSDPKIYGITSKQKQIMKMLQTIGLIKKQQSQIVVSKLPSVSLINSQTPKIKIIEKKVSQKSLKMDQNKKQQIMATELSKIEGLNSVISDQVKQKDLNVSILSQSPSSSRVKVKRIINKNKKKDTTPQVNIPSQYYTTDKKQNEVPNFQKNELRTSRKKTLRSQQKQSLEKPKKNLKFVDSPKQESKIKRIKSISRVQPKKIEIVTQSNATNTENEYFQNYTKPVKPSTLQPQTIKISHCENKTPSTLQNYLKNTMSIDAIFYRQFVQNYKYLTDFIKHNSGSLLPQAENSIIQPFFNMSQFDRYARKIKRKLIEGGHHTQNFNFMAFILQQELTAFEKYCFEKNRSYQQQGYEMDISLKASNFSSTYSSIKNPNIMIYVFIESADQEKEKTMDFGRIKILEYGFPRVVQDQNLEKTLQYIRDKLIQNNLTDSREYFRS